MNIENKTESLNDKIIIVKGKCFPFLDISKYWDPNNKLRFKIYMKENQKLKYLNNVAATPLNASKPFLMVFSRGSSS